MKLNDEKSQISAADFLPSRDSLPALRKPAKNCEGCHLYNNATQTVFGEGLSDAIIMVGEIPGTKKKKLVDHLSDPM